MGTRHGSLERVGLGHGIRRSRRVARLSGQRISRPGGWSDPRPGIGSEERRRAGQVQRVRDGLACRRRGCQQGLLARYVSQLPSWMMQSVERPPSPSRCRIRATWEQAALLIDWLFRSNLRQFPKGMTGIRFGDSVPRFGNQGCTKGVPACQRA